VEVRSKEIESRAASQSDRDARKDYNGPAGFARRRSAKDHATGVSGVVL
jgi:hypothetical protein